MILLESAIATAVVDKVDVVLIQEAKMILATHHLRSAMVKGGISELRAAIVLAEGDMKADEEVVRDAKSLLGVLGTEALQKAMETRDLTMVRSALVSAETVEAVETTLIEVC